MQFADVSDELPTRHIALVVRICASCQTFGITFQPCWQLLQFLSIDVDDTVDVLLCIFISACRVHVDVPIAVSLPSALFK